MRAIDWARQVAVVLNPPPPLTLQQQRRALVAFWRHLFREFHGVSGITVVEASPTRLELHKGGSTIAFVEGYLDVDVIRYDWSVTGGPSVVGSTGTPDREVVKAFGQAMGPHL